MITLQRLLVLPAALAFASCVSNTTLDSSRSASESELRTAIDLGEYHKVREELPGLQRVDPDGAAAVVEYGLSTVVLVPGQVGVGLADSRELLAALDVPGPFQTRVSYARGLAAFKADDVVSARAHFDTVVAVTDSTASQRAVSHFLLALLRPDPAGMPDREHWQQFAALQDAAVGALDPQYVARVTDLMAEPEPSTLARQR